MQRSWLAGWNFIVTTKPLLVVLCCGVPGFLVYMVVIKSLVIKHNLQVEDSGGCGWYLEFLSAFRKHTRIEQSTAACVSSFGPEIFQLASRTTLVFTAHVEQYSMHGTYQSIVLALSQSKGICHSVSCSTIPSLELVFIPPHLVYLFLRSAQCLFFFQLLADVNCQVVYGLC